MTQYKWKLVYRWNKKNAKGKAYLTLKALLKDNGITKDEIERDIDRVKSHHGVVNNNTGIGGKWECRYYRLTPKRAVYLSNSFSERSKFTCYLHDLEIWKDY